MNFSTLMIDFGNILSSAIDTVIDIKKYERNKLSNHLNRLEDEMKQLENESKPGDILILLNMLNEYVTPDEFDLWQKKLEKNLCDMKNILDEIQNGLTESTETDNIRKELEQIKNMVIYLIGKSCIEKEFTEGICNLIDKVNKGLEMYRKLGEPKINWFQYDV